ncbi:BafA family autotransporter [Bartonella sp. B17]
MQYKWKLNCLALVFSSCFMQAAIAGKGKAQFFCQPSKYDSTEKMFYGKEGLKIEKCIKVTPPKSDPIIETHRKSYFIKNFLDVAPSKSSGIFPNSAYENNSNSVRHSVQRENIVTLGDSELIFVKDGAILKNFVLNNNAQVYVSNDGLTGNPGKSINNVIMNGAAIYVDAGGLSENSQIENGGIEVIRASREKQGFSKNAVVNKGGKQIISNGGKATEIKIYGGQQLVFGGVDVGEQVKGSTASDIIIYGQDESLGQQKVYDGGIVWNTKVMQGAVQDITKEDQNAKNGGSAFDTELFGDGKQRVFAGGRAIRVTLNEAATQEVYADGYVKNLTIRDNATSLVRAGATLEGIVFVNNSGQLHLYAGNDQHRTTAEEVILNGQDTKLYSITARSDGQSSIIQKLSGDGSVIFAFTGSDPYYSQLHINNLSGNLHFEFNTNLAHDRGDYLFVENGEGNHTISVVDSGVEITDSSSKNRVLITDKSGGAYFTLESLSGKKINAIDGGAYMYGLKQREDENGKIWFLSADRIDGSEIGGSEVGVLGINAYDFGEVVITPSTDAVLSTAVSPELIFNNELQVVRIGRGVLEKKRIGRGLDKNKNNTALWTYAIKSRESIATGYSNFKLEQTGMILGADQLNELVHGDLYVGGFGSYDQARVAHARGGASHIDTYSIGTYVTYFDNNRWYLDGVLKFNYYQDDLNAISTNDSAIQGNYNQWAIGGSFEMGCRFEISQDSWMQPHVKITGVQVEDKKIKLSNGMTGDISSFASLRNEVGLFAGHEFIIGTDIPLTAYITAAWLRENVNNNHTTINKEHKFFTDLSGNAGKLGIGLNSFINDKLTLQTEAYYLKGRKIKRSLQGSLGIRYSF